MRKLETGHKTALATLVISIVACIGAYLAFGRGVLDVPGIPPRPVDTWTRPTDGAVMVYVPAGEFLMGSTDDNPCAYDNEKLQHTVYHDTFWIDETEVTTPNTANAWRQEPARSQRVGMMIWTTLLTSPSYA